MSEATTLPNEPKPLPLKRNVLGSRNATLILKLIENPADTVSW